MYFIMSTMLQNISRIPVRTHPSCLDTKIHIRYMTMDSDSFSAAYMRQWNPESALVQIMACRLLGAKSLSEPMLDCCQLDP